MDQEAMLDKEKSASKDAKKKNNNNPKQRNGEIYTETLASSRPTHVLLYSTLHASFPQKICVVEQLLEHGYDVEPSAS